MSNVHQAIRAAVEKGGYRYRWWKVNDLESNEGYNGFQLRALSEHFQDPDFWKALATARRWEDVNAWRFHWHRFIDHLADGGDVESLRGFMKVECASRSRVAFGAGYGEREVEPFVFINVISNR